MSLYANDSGKAPQEEEYATATVARVKGDPVYIGMSAGVLVADKYTSGFVDVTLFTDFAVHKIMVADGIIAAGYPGLYVSKGEVVINVPSGTYVVGNGLQVLDGVVIDSGAVFPVDCMKEDAQNVFGEVKIGGVGVTSITAVLHGECFTGRDSEEENPPSEPPVQMDDAQGFAILAGSTVTNTGATVITGDLGLSPGTAVVGFPPGSVIGTQHITDAAAAAAQVSLTAAMIDAAGRTPATTISGDIGGTTKLQGIYNSATTLGITGTLTLDAEGDADAVWIFQVGSALTTATSSVVSLINGADAANVFWQVGTSATLGVTSVMKGTIMADQSITLNTGATLDGRALASVGAVTLDGNTVTLP